MNLSTLIPHVEMKQFKGQFIVRARYRTRSPEFLEVVERTKRTERQTCGIFILFLRLFYISKLITTIWFSWRLCEQHNTGIRSPRRPWGLHSNKCCLSQSLMINQIYTITTIWLSHGGVTKQRAQSAFCRHMKTLTQGHKCKLSHYI